jgi:hypothetical protein
LHELWFRERGKEKLGVLWQWAHGMSNVPVERPPKSARVCTRVRMRSDGHARAVRQRGTVRSNES